MPLFTYTCPDGHATDLIRHREIVSVVCACGQEAYRGEVNRLAVTGFTPTPTNQKNYRREFSEYREAASEVDYVYSRHEANGDPVKSPNMFRAGIAQAKQQGL